MLEKCLLGNTCVGIYVTGSNLQLHYIVFKQMGSTRLRSGPCSFENQKRSMGPYFLTEVKRSIVIVRYGSIMLTQVFILSIENIS